MKTTHMKYAWRVLRADGEPTSIIVALSDDADTIALAAVARAAEENGVRLEPVLPEELDDAA